MSVRTVYTCDLCGNTLEVEGRSRWADGWSVMQKLDAEYNILAEMDICSRSECRQKTNEKAMSMPEFLRKLEATS